MDAGYVKRNKQLEAAVKEAEAQTQPVICWPEDVGHIDPSDLPFIDLEEASKKFVVLESHWRYSDEPLTLPRPGYGYAVVEEIENTSGVKMNVVTFRPKTLDECDKDNERDYMVIAALQNALIMTMGTFIETLAEQFVHPDVSIEDYPELSEQLDGLDELNDSINALWKKVTKDETDDAGSTE